MRLVQSTWFDNEDKLKGNWPEEKFALFSIALSYHLLKKQGLVTVLNTDTIGFDIIVNQLGLSYDVVDISLDFKQLEEKVGHFASKYWSLYKLRTYSRQEEPFIHFDNDVYCFKKLDRTWLSANLIAQNQENKLPYYTNCLEQIQKYFRYIPEYLKMEPQSVLAVNAGIAGGANFRFFKNLFEEVIKFLNANCDELAHLTEGFANIFIEQCIFKTYADSLDIPFQYILPHPVGETKDYRVNQFHLVPDKADYIHVMNYKSNPTICESVARTLYLTDRKLYHHCVDVAKSVAGRRAVTLRNRSDVHCIKDDAELKYYFRRTAKICEVISNAIPDFSSIDNIETSIHILSKQMTAERFSIIEDVFFFERERYGFFRALGTDYFKTSYEIFAVSQKAIMKDDWENLTVSLGVTAALIESKWNWVESNEFREVGENGYLNNVHLSPGYFATMIYYYPEQNIPKEHPLDIISSLIVNLSRQNMPVKQLISEARRVLPDTGDPVELDQVLIKKIRFLIFQGALTISA